MEKMYRVLLSAGAVLMLSGCGMATDVDVKVRSDKTGYFKVTAGYDEEALYAMASLDYDEDEEADEEAIAEMVELLKADCKEVKYNGKTYYCDSEKLSFSDTSELEELLTESEVSEYASTGLFDAVYASRTTFYAYPAGEDLGEENFDELSDEDFDFYFEFSVSFPSTVKKTNGKLSTDGKTVTWDYDFYQSGKNFYATTTDRVYGPLVTNIDKGAVYDQSVTITKLSGMGTMYLNGERIDSGKRVTKSAKYTLFIMNQKRSKSTIHFIVDKKAPVISGAADGKTYSKSLTLTFKDSLSGIKSVKVNSAYLTAEQISDGYRITKSGSYKVIAKDKAGNQLTINFTIKKK